VVEGVARTPMSVDRVEAVAVVAPMFRDGFQVLWHLVLRRLRSAPRLRVGSITHLERPEIHRVSEPSV